MMTHRSETEACAAAARAVRDFWLGQVMDCVAPSGAPERLELSLAELYGRFAVVAAGVEGDIRARLDDEDMAAAPGDADQADVSDAGLKTMLAEHAAMKACLRVIARQSGVGEAGRRARDCLRSLGIGWE